jgi:hypothetical protein
VSLWDVCPSEHPQYAYESRAKAVYWNKDFPACRAKGPDHAECLLNPGHAGDHYGNGYDEWGPDGAFSWPEGEEK